MAVPELEPWQVELADAAVAAESNLRAAIAAAQERLDAAEAAFREARLALTSVGRWARPSIGYQLGVAREALLAAEALAAPPAPEVDYA